MTEPNVRLDVETERLLDRLAKDRRATRSDVVREAVFRLAETDSGNDGAIGPYAAIEDLIGAAEDGPKDLAENHKRIFRERLARDERRQ